MRICPICHINECEDDKYCPSCCEAVTKIGMVLQTIGASAEEANKAFESLH